MTEFQQQDQQPQDRYEQLLDYMKVLFKRSNLCDNTYLYKKMNGSLTVPLYIIAEERNISSISRNYEDIIDAIENSGLAHVIKGREVKIIQFPTIKISIQSHEGLRILQQMLNEKEKKYEISKRTDSKEFINLTVFSENIIWLEKLIQKIDKQIIYERVNLLKDIQLGVDRIRKLKFQHAKIKTALGKCRYSLDKPPLIFVRKALESSESDNSQQQETRTEIKKNNRQKKRRYLPNPNRARKPRLQAEDFPLLK